jgi:hypothetical protein
MTTLTMRDVAALAGVQRSVVSMWRRRQRVRGRHLPFPEPVGVAAGVEHFDRDDVVAWLEETGRGNNREARQDAPSLAIPDGIDLEDVVALVALHVLTGADLGALTAVELIELAEQADPDDRLLLREVRAVGAAAEPLLRYVDDLVDASYGAPDALTRVESGRLTRKAGERGLRADLCALVQAVAAAARVHLGGDGVALVPPTDHRLARHVAEGFAGILVGGDDEEARAHRRRAVIDGAEVLDASAVAVRVLSLVGRPHGEALEVLDDLAVSLGRREVGIVLGAAAVLCDPLVGDAERRRAQTLRTRMLALAVRLPRGLWKGAHRQSLALWVLDGARDAPDLDLADLDGESVDIDELASDVTAALSRSSSRAFRYARRADLAPVLAGGPVVPRGVRALRFGASDPGSHVDRIHAATLTTSEPVGGYDVAVAPSPGRIVLRRRSLAELVAAGQLVVKSGRRVRQEHGDPNGTVPVLSADGSTDGLRLDPFDARGLYPRAAWTEPGDVIVLDRPRPMARVDVHGGALVASPSRILRLLPGAPLGPHALAALVTELAAEGSEWRTWSVPELSAHQAATLDSALAAAAEHLAELRRRERATRDLVTTLIDGVAAGAVTLLPLGQEG